MKATSFVVALALAASPAAAKGKRAAKADPCASEGPADGPGSLDPFRPPLLAATELNAAGKIPYRQGKWDEARAKYRAAEAADPELLAAKLNVACSFVRQERFDEATAEVVALLDRAYVPWAREVLEAADLGALKARPEGKKIQAAMAAAAAKWSEGLTGSAVFVARKGAPLHVPEGAGVFILNPHQEAWAFTPRTRRYRQLTAEDGHVVAVARAADGKTLVYVTAEKLVRAAPPGGGVHLAASLRGVALHSLSLATMAPGPVVAVEGDVERLDVGVGPTGATVYALTGSKLRGTYVVDASGALAPAAGTKAVRTLVTLTGEGVAPPKSAKAPPPIAGAPTCDSRLATEVVAGAASLVYRPPTGDAFPLAAKAGAGKTGLPIP
jgi:hypothetical protein